MRVEFTECHTKDFPDFDTFRAKHPTGFVHSVNGKPVAGMCESCGLFVTEDEQYQSNEADGAILCERCSNGVSQ